MKLCGSQYRPLYESAESGAPDFFEMFLPEPLSDSEMDYVRSSNYFENEEECRTFLPALEVEIKAAEETYSFCRCPEPKARKIVKTITIKTINIDEFQWLWMLFIICFAIPSFVIVYCYSKFVINVSRVNRDVKNFDQNSAKKKLETPARLTVLVAILCLAFFWQGC